MATSATPIESGVGQSSRTIDPARFERACTEGITVMFTGSGIAEIKHGDNTYRVELASGACECPDYQFHGDRFICKHVQRACLSVLFDADQQNTHLVIQVARFARNAGCEHGVSGCSGPMTTADRLDGLPCPGCCDAVRAPTVDERTVWNRLVASEVE